MTNAEDKQEGKLLKDVTPCVLYEISEKYGISYKDLCIKAGILTKRGTCNHDYPKTGYKSGDEYKRKDYTCQKCGFNWMEDIKYG